MIKTVTSPLLGDLVFESVVNMIRLISAPVLLMLPGGFSAIPFFQSFNRRREEWVDIADRITLAETDGFSPSEKRPHTNFDTWIQQMPDVVGIQIPHKRMILISPHLKEKEFDPLDVQRSYHEKLGQFENKIIVLGVGGGYFSDNTEDTGHVAGIFPNRPKMWETELLVGIEMEAPKEPLLRVTITPKLIETAHLAIGIITSTRHRSLHHFTNGGTEKEVPSKVIKRASNWVLATDAS